MSQAVGETKLGVGKETEEDVYKILSRGILTTLLLISSPVYYMVVYTIFGDLPRHMYIRA